MARRGGRLFLVAVLLAATLCAAQVCNDLPMSAAGVLLGCFVAPAHTKLWQLAARTQQREAREPGWAALMRGNERVGAAMLTWHNSLALLLHRLAGRRRATAQHPAAAT
jgi:hypothetical protein